MTPAIFPQIIVIGVFLIRKEKKPTVPTIKQQGGTQAFFFKYLKNLLI